LKNYLFAKENKMEKFFIVKDEEFINKKKKSEKDKEIIAKHFDEFAKENGIEATSFVPCNTFLHIVPTEKDYENFGKFFVKGNKGLFKKNSILSKKWIDSCKVSNISTPINLTWKLIDMIDYRYIGKSSSRLFFLNNVLYGSYEAEHDFTLNEKYFKELKPSEYYLAIGE